MTDLRELNSAVQNATFPTIQFAQTVREWIAAATKEMEPKIEGEKVECPNCKAAVEQPWAHYPGGWRCPTLPAQPEAPGLLEAVQRISDSIGWRSTQGDDPTLYYCEFCSEAHPDWRNVPHHDECPVFVIRAAIAKATTPMSNKPAQPEPAVRIQTMEEAMEESLRMVRGEPASPVEMLNVECSVCCSLEPCAHDCAEPAAPSEMPVFLRSVRGLIRMAISPECYPVADTKKAAQNVRETTDALEAEWRARAAQPDPAAPVENIVLDGATATRRKRELEEAVAAPVNAGRAVRRFGRMLSGLGGGEPVAPSEMPEVLDDVATMLHAYGEDTLADALESWWRTHSQPTPWRMTEELERVLEFAEQTISMGVSEGWRQSHLEKMKLIVAAVRSQAAGGVKLPKVPVADIQWALNIAASRAVTMSALEACQRIKKFLAEIDAAERGE